MRRAICSLLLLVAALATSGAQTPDKLKVLLVDGQNNHDWRGCQPIIKWALESCGRFAVDVASTPQPPRGLGKNPSEAEKAAYDVARKEFAAAWQAWRPKFKDYAAVVSNYNGDDWPKDTKDDFVAYVRGGGGLVTVHAADNSWSNWPEFNEMIGVGGWGGRNEKSGPYLHWKDGAIVRETAPGGGGTHGRQHEFTLDVREPEHPIMKGLPAHFKTATDELYARLRGPAKNLTVLATSLSAKEQAGTGLHEPILMVLDYGQGRVFHSVLGHGTQAMSGLAFQVTLQRGTEWAATGKVTLPPPADGALTADKAALNPKPKP